MDSDVEGQRFWGGFLVGFWQTPGDTEVRIIEQIIGGKLLESVVKLGSLLN